MKKAYPWILAAGFFVLAVSLGVMGVKILDHNYDYMAEAYIALIAWIVVFTCLLIRAWMRAKCPHCGKMMPVRGNYCPHCGEKM